MNHWPLGDRLAWLRRFSALLAADAENLCALVHHEVHKSTLEALTGDLAPLLDCCAWHRRYAPRLLAPRRTPGRALLGLGQRHHTARAPLGTVGIIATWNYPLQLLGIQLVQALVAGNRVIVKPSERAPRSQARLLALAHAAGLPAGQLTSLPATRQAGIDLLHNHALDHVIFTGSTTVGRNIARWAAENLVSSTLELSGNDSAIVLDDADPALAARSIWFAVTMNAGQTCMAPRRAIVTRAAYPQFLRHLGLLAAGARPMRLIDQPAARLVEHLAADAVARGGRPLSGVLEPADGPHIRPLAIAECPPDCALAEGDHFGPALAVIPADNTDHALSLHRQFNQHLAASLYTADLRAARALAPTLGASVVTINDSVIPTGHPGASLGGAGPSGWGFSRGQAGLLALSRPLIISTTGRLLRTPTSPPPASMLRHMFSFIKRWHRAAASNTLPPEADAPPPVGDPPLPQDATPDRARQPRSDNLARRSP